MRLPIRILLITMLFIPTLLIAQESNPKKPYEDSEPSADSESSASSNKEPSADSESSASSNKEPSADKEPSAASNEEPSATTNKETQDDRDFKPSEEISEDFPVPLPSDI